MGTRFGRLAGPLAAALALGATPAHAADVGPMFKVGWDTGRTVFLKVPFADGPSQQIRVNDGLYAGGGISVVNDDRSLEGELSVSYKAKLVTGENGQVDWNRIPIDALAFYRTTNYRFGGGLTYHTFVRLRGTGDAQMFVEFENALGFVGQIDMLFGERGSVGLRFLKLEYKAKGFDYKAKSDGIGITASMSFW
jgi:hypothetical protein